MAKKVMFVFYPLYVKYSHAVALLSALCKQKGIETELFLCGDVEGFVKRLEGSRPDYVSFSFVTEHD